MYSIRYTPRSLSGVSVLSLRYASSKKQQERLMSFSKYTPPSSNCSQLVLNAKPTTGEGNARVISISFCDYLYIYIYIYLNLTYSQWASFRSCLWSLRIFPSLPGSRLTNFYRDASSALLQLVNQWLNFTYSHSHAFSYGRKDTISGDKNQTHDFRTSRNVQVIY